MTSTARKLDEAWYFLKKFNINDPYFDYILSAFLNAARSTTWVMRFEYNKVPGWEEWYKSIKVTKQQQKLLKMINEWRILSTKQSGIRSDFYLFDYIIPDDESFPVLEDFLNQRNINFKITITPLEDSEIERNVKGIYNIKGRIVKNRKKSEFKRESILKLCKDYFDFLENIEKECRDKFILLNDN